MRELKTFPAERDAVRLTAVLNARSLPATVEEEDGSFVVWIRNDDDRDAARVVLERFIAEPDAAEFASAEADALKRAMDAERAEASRRKLRVNIQDRWAGVWYRCYPFTMLLIASCLFVVAACTDFQQEQNGGPLSFRLCNDDESQLLQALYIQKPTTVSFGGMTLLRSFGKPDLPATLRSGEIWRPFTPMLLHFSFLHILFNMMWLNDLGRRIEFVRGTRRFVVLVLVTSGVSGVAELYWSGPLFGGMSGVVFGLIGYAWMRGRTQPEQGIALAPNQIVYSMLWMLLCMGGAFGPIANAAHAAGFVSGSMIGGRQALLRRARQLLSGASRGAGP